MANKTIISSKYKGKNLHDVAKDVGIDNILDIIFEYNLYVCVYCDCIVDISELNISLEGKCNKCKEKENGK